MALMLYLAGAIGCLFLFFLSADKSEDTAYFVYLEYSSLLLVFFFLGMGIREYIDSDRETKRRSYELKMNRKSARRQRIRDKFRKS